MQGGMMQGGMMGQQQPMGGQGAMGQMMGGNQFGQAPPMGMNNMGGGNSGFGFMGNRWRIYTLNNWF